MVASDGMLRDVPLQSNIPCFADLTLPLRLRRGPVHFCVAAAVVTQEAVAGLAAGIGQGDEGNGSVVEGAGRLVMEQMDFGHHGNRGDIPGGGCLFLAGNQFFRMAVVTLGFVSLDAAEMGGVVCDFHRSTTARLGTSQMFMLQGLNEPSMSFLLLI
jgi:hypothetical protein